MEKAIRLAKPSVGGSQVANNAKWLTLPPPPTASQLNDGQPSMLMIVLNKVVLL